MPISHFMPPLDPYFLPPIDFETLIGRMGQRVSWMHSYSCPCVYTQAAFQGKLAIAGSPQKSCQTCFGVGIYWSLPSPLFSVGMTFRAQTPTPREPGVTTEENFGGFQMGEPSLSIPYWNPYLDPGDSRQSTNAWKNASVNDMFAAVDMTARYTAMLQVGGQVNLPFQQNLSVATTGAVTVWNVPTQTVVRPNSYTVTGPAVTLTGYPNGTPYMVEFAAAALYVARRRAGGLPHSRPLAAGTVNEPKVFRIETLDFWTRQRGVQPVVGIGDSCGIAVTML